MRFVEISGETPWGASLPRRSGGILNTEGFWMATELYLFNGGVQDSDLQRSNDLEKLEMWEVEFRASM
jgi:hypothetical protein